MTHSNVDLAAARIQESIDFAPGTQYTSRKEYLRDLEDPRYRQHEYFREMVQEKLSRSMANLNRPVVEPKRSVPEGAVEIRFQDGQEINPWNAGKDTRGIPQMLADGVTVESYAANRLETSKPITNGKSINEMLDDRSK